MIKGLDALSAIISTFLLTNKRYMDSNCEIYNMKSGKLYKPQELTDIIKKELKALEIIKDTLGIRLFETIEDNTLGETHYYIEIGGVVSYQLKEKEKYDLLKEALLQ